MPRPKKEKAYLDMSIAELSQTIDDYATELSLAFAALTQVDAAKEKAFKLLTALGKTNLSNPLNSAPIVSNSDLAFVSSPSAQTSPQVLTSIGKPDPDDAFAIEFVVRPMQPEETEAEVLGTAPLVNTPTIISSGTVPNPDEVAPNYEAPIDESNELLRQIQVAKANLPA